MAIERVRRVGRYAPLSANYYMDDDIVDAGPDAELLYLRGLAFCAGRDSDGYISEGQLTRFVGVGMSDVVDRAKALVEVGLWQREPGGYLIRSWLRWNRSAEELGHYRARDRERKSAARQDDHAPNQAHQNVRADSARTASRNPSGVRPDSETASDTHYTTHHYTTDKNSCSFDEQMSDGNSDSDVPQNSAGNSDAEVGSDAASASKRKRGRKPKPTNDSNFDRFWQAYPLRVGKGQAERAWKTATDLADVETLIASARQFAYTVRNKDPKYIAHPTTWLNGKRWLDEDATRQAHGDATGGSFWDN